MTLLLALMGNDAYAQAYGEPFIATGWIVVLWIGHIIANAGS